MDLRVKLNLIYAVRIRVPQHFYWVFRDYRGTVYIYSFCVYYKEDRHERNRPTH